MARLLLICGAGASYDASPGAPNRNVADRAPLTAELVSEQYGSIAAEFPASRPVISRLRGQMRTDPTLLLESELAALQQRAQTNPTLRRQLVAFRFYLHAVIQGSTDRLFADLHGFTNYVTLLDHIAEWRFEGGHEVVAVTFNYDKLLDSAIEDQLVDWRFTSLDSYIQRDDWKLIKPHGSVDWVRMVRVQDGGGGRNPQRVITDPGESDLGPVVWEGDAAYEPGMDSIPALAVPTDAKDTFECPREHEAAFHDAIPDATHVLLIGWRAAEELAVTALAERLMPGYRLGIITAGRESLAEVVSNLGLAYEKSPAEKVLTLYDGFSEALADGGRTIVDWLSDG